MNTASATVLNFAYGSNMLLRRIRARVPSARPLGVAMLPGHELRWHKVSTDGSGKCDALPSSIAGSVLYGVLYEISSAEKPRLDLAEGVGAGYEEKRIEVMHRSQPTPCTAYLATRTDPNCLPYAWYKALVVAGAREHGLPAAYIQMLEGTRAVDDHDVARYSEHMALLDDG